MTRPNENHWVFGRGAHIEFENGTDIVVRPPTPIQCWEGSASIADPQNGELLFYTDGDELWDANHALITSALGSNQHADTPFQTPVNGALIVPPIAPSINYHVFSTAATGSGEGPPNDLMHTLISVTGSGTNATIARASSTVGVWAGTETTEAMAAIHNHDCTGYWLVTQRLDTTTMHTVAINGDTLGPFKIQNFTALNDFSGLPGMMKFSPDTSKLAYATSHTEEIVVFDFDNATGVLTNPRKISGINGDVYGLEFSPNSSLIYYTTIRHPERAVYQAPVPNFDTPHSSSFQVHDATMGPTDHWFGSLQLGPDDRIYISEFSETHLSAVQNPNIVGAGCNFQDFVLDKNGDQVALTEPQTFGLPAFTRIDASCMVKETSDCGLFLWSSGSVLNHHYSPGTVEPIKVSFATYNKPGTDLISHQSLAPLPYDANLIDLFFMKDPDLGGYTGTIDFDLVVLDIAGNLLRTISASPINYGSAAGWTWINIPLTSTPADLLILSGEIIAGQLTFGSMPSSGVFPFQMTGRGKFA